LAGVLVRASNTTPILVTSLGGDELKIWQGYTKIVLLGLISEAEARLDEK